MVDAGYLIGIVESMKNYLAVFLGKPDAMGEWMARPDRAELEKQGMEAWMQWAQAHQGDIVNMGSPLGKTKKVSAAGVEDIRNEMGAWCVVQADSYEAAAAIFANHPHFTIFPGDRIEVMECLPIPQMQ